jgi:hypothetical protein
MNAEELKQEILAFHPSVVFDKCKYRFRGCIDIAH